MQPENKLEGLQIARALAALSVAYFHSYRAVRGFPETAAIPIPALANAGFLGVNFFFAISGFVICLVASRPDFNIAGFFIKRVFRLYPMYWFVLIFAALMIVTGFAESTSLANFLYSATLLPSKAAPYYDVSWSLQRELVFYAIAAVVMPILGPYGLALALGAFAYYGLQLSNPWSLQIVSTIQSDFLAGVLVFIVRKPASRLGSIIPLTIGTGLLAYQLKFPTPFGTSVAWIPLLIGFINLKLPWEKAPVRWFVQAGDASYSIYLTHPIVFFFSAVLSSHLIQQGSFNWLVEPWRYAVLIVCCWLSFWCWMAIEKPMIAFGHKLSGDRPKPTSVPLQSDDIPV